jgi:hypothetical protein
MVSLKKFIGALLLLLTGYLTMSCDDFFSPTIEIFNKLENPTTIDQNPTTIDQNPTTIDQN